MITFFSIVGFSLVSGLAVGFYYGHKSGEKRVRTAMLCYGLSTEAIEKMTNTSSWLFK